VTRLHLDYETYSEADLRAVGLDVYSAHPTTRILLCAYAWDGGPVQFWQESDGPFPRDVAEALADPTVQKWAFNAQFERVITRRVAKIPTPIRNWRCTMALAYMQSFTGDLADVGRQLGLPEDRQKQKDGRRLITKFSKPQRISKRNPNPIRDELSDPEDWRRFCDYCVQDVVTETAVYSRLIRFPIPAEEWDLYELDQRINDRGIPIDLRFVQQAIRMSERRTNHLVQRMREITDLPNPNAVGQLLEWLQHHGYPWRDLQKATVQKALTEHRDTPGGIGLHPMAEEVLRLRQWAARISPKKYGTVQAACGQGDRMRFVFQFHGASRTARWAGRRMQPQNMPRTPKALESPKGVPEGALLEIVTDLIRGGDYEGVELYAREIMELLVGCARSMIRAKPGHVLIVSDLAAIESRVIAWLSGCERLLNVFREGRDPYKDFGQTLYRCSYDAVTKEQRSNSKPAVLGAGYRLGGGELRDGKRTGLWGYAESMGVEMTQPEAERAVAVFRETYAEIPELWYALENAVLRCVHRGRTVSVGAVTFEMVKPYLTVILPSGRRLYYYKPRITRETFVSRKTGKPYEKLVFSHMGSDQKTGQWRRMASHGGKLVENLVQAIAREVLVVGMRRAAADGFNIVLHVHDEIVALHPPGDNRHTLERLREHMMAPIPWLPGLPLDAAGYTAEIYRKD
jgi:DNA polymerase bacteriophage-type